jgi:arylamine N-acetyltransferase
MNVSEYLSRIGFDENELEYLSNAKPTVATLRDLHKRHLAHITFENMDIGLNVYVPFNDLAATFAKIISGASSKQRRGGVCIELNQLFNWLLKQLGFTTRLVQCNVFQTTQRLYSPLFTHIAILVQIQDETYLADVGFSFGFCEPLLFASNKKLHGDVQRDSTGSFRLTKLVDENGGEAGHFSKEEGIVDEVLRDKMNMYELWRLVRGDEVEASWLQAYMIDVPETEVDPARFKRPLAYVMSPDCPRFSNRTLVIRHADGHIAVLAGYSLTRFVFDGHDGVGRQGEKRVLGSARELRELLRTEFRLDVSDEYEPRQIDL